MNEAEDDTAHLRPEYEMAAPPRNRTTPSGALAWAWERLKETQPPVRHAVDVGCGRGRNTLFLARKGVDVTALDFTPNAIEALQAATARHKPGGRVRAIAQDVSEQWPIAPQSADLIIDMFCFKHLSSHIEQVAYKDNLMRVLNRTGHYLLAFTSIGDGYYGRYMRRPGQPRLPADTAVSVDPVNGVESGLYTPEKAIAFFKPEFEVCGELKAEPGGAEAGSGGVYALLFKRSLRHFYSW